MTNQIKAPKPRKTSSVRHTKAITLDRTKHQPGVPPPEQVEQLLQKIIHPLTFQLMRIYSEMGLRQRTLTLPVMLAFVLSLIWRQIGSVSEAVRVLSQDGMLWQPPTRVSQQAVNARLRQMPPALFERLLLEILPVMHQRWQDRKRPMTAQLQTALSHFKRIVAADGSTLDAVVKKVGLLKDEEGNVLAGKMLAVLDVANQLPIAVFYTEHSEAHDQSFWEQLIPTIGSGELVLLDLGFVNYERYGQLSQKGSYWVTRVKSNMVYEKVSEVREAGSSRSYLIEIGAYSQGTGQLLRLVEVEYEGKTYNYLTNVLDPARLSAEEVAYLYRERWRIEDAFKSVKRLLGLAYFYSGSLNAVSLQVWATWLLYCVLSDLVDEVASEVQQPVKRISVEMVYRGLYHYSLARSKGETLGAAQYLALHQKVLSIVKTPRKQQLRA
jgi:hypothetical protein